MSANFRDITITSLETITVFNPLTGAYRFTMDELQDATISNTQDTVDITGKQGRRLNTLKRNKAVTISGNNGLISGGLMELQVGSEFENLESTPVKWADYLKVSNDSAITTYKAVGTAGNEIIEVLVKDANGVVTERLTQDATAAEGKFAYAPDTKTITFNTDELEDGTEIVVYYYRNVKGSRLENISDKYSEKGEIFIDAFGEDVCNKVYRVQFHIPRGDFSGNFDLTLGDDQTVHAFEINSLAGNCGGSGALWDYTVFDSDAADAA